MKLFTTLPLLSVKVAVLFLITYVTVFSVSGAAIPTMNLDDSWQVVLEYSVLKNMQFGTDLVFTYGPLGYLGTTISRGFLVWQRILFALVGAGMVAWGVTFLALRIPKPANYLFIGCFLFLSDTGFMEHYAYVVMAVNALLLLGDWQRYKVMTAAFISALVVVSLIKFTLFLAAGATILVCCSVHIGKKEYRPALLTASFFGAVFVLLWLMNGQQLTHIWPWIRNSLEISGGYTEAMSIVPRPGVLSLCGTAYLLFLGGGILRAIALKRTSTGIAFLLLTAAYVFLSWKHGFVRADDHVQSFYLFLPMAFGMLQAAPDAGAPMASTSRTAIYLLNVVVVCLCVWAGSLQRTDFKNKILNYPATFQNHLHQLLTAATGNLPRSAQRVPAEIPPGSPHDLPRIKALVGNDPIDVFSHAQLAALENNLNYRPRPVIQSYSAYTPYLQNLNSAFYRSDRRPIWLLFKLQTIDRRFMTLDDAPLLPYLLKNYEIAGGEGEFLLLKLRQNPPADLRLNKLHEQEITFGEALNLSRWSDAPLYLRVDITPTFMGKVVAFLYQLPPVTITSASGGQQITNRFIPALARNGFMVSPLLLNNDVLADFYQGRWLVNDVVSFDCASSSSAWYARSIKVQLFTIE